MDINNIKKVLEEDYKCQLIIIIDYADHKFAKGLETTNEGILYRYFKILKDNKLEEIKDEELLNYFRLMNETNDENNY